ncbi:hypothetical protein ACTI_81360 [Actinoplanes sp. OR16]|uniref:hypothetical protein n=1 Tax=Actinoplanes sp. OR16 TaxID=946334 RepID=UPI000F6D8195|nr:hypothetical protein [Actinoplanes sp. OR16]BBH71451.1 hypothetical protein ACTI_81360 [Actinoplanes sp. OR16]
MRFLGFIAFVAIFLGIPSPALAHAGGLTATDGRGTLVSVTPQVPGLQIRVIENGARLLIRNGTAQSVLIGQTSIPPGRTRAWTDGRITPEGRSPAPGETVRWTIPLHAQDTVVVVTGEIRGEEPPLAPVWWAATVLVGMLLVLLSRRISRGDVLLCVAGLVAAAASITHVIGSTLVVESAPLVTTFLSAAGINLLAWPLIIGGAVVALRGRAGGVLAVCGGAALTAVFVLPDVTSFHRAVVPFAGPAVVERVLVVLALGLGAGIAVAGAGVLRTLARQPSALLLAGILLLGGCTQSDPADAVPASCGSAAPGSVPIDAVVREGRAEPAPHRVSVPLNSTILLGVTADVAGDVHVHGYDVEFPVQADQPACVFFAADVAGLHDIEMHPSTLLLQIEVR